MTMAEKREADHKPDVEPETLSKRSSVGVDEDEEINTCDHV